MGMGRNWTTGELRRLHEMWQEGFEGRAIAKALGRTTNAIYNRLRYLPSTRSQAASSGPTPARERGRKGYGPHTFGRAA